MRRDRENVPPRIMLVGVGRFGKNHLRVWRALEEKGKVILAGVVVKSKKSQEKIKKKYRLPVFVNLSAGMLRGVDGVDIVTPYSTHYALVKKCLHYTNVLVEKPLADTFKKAQALHEEAKKQKRILMVGHIYRFHPTVQKIKSLLSKSLIKPDYVSGEFISPLSTHRDNEALLEKLHFFDILDYLFGQEPSIAWSKKDGLITTVNLRYPNGMDVRLRLGWEGKRKSRVMQFNKDKEKISCDFIKNTITIEKAGRRRNVLCPSKSEPLEKELSIFIKILRGEDIFYPDSNIGSRIVAIAERTGRMQKKKHPKIAIIGGGIFGTTCALELSKHFPVTLFERHADILTEASRANQYRHHMGYHYPRSPETIQEIKNSTRDFEQFYKSIIISKFPAYYCVARKDSLFTASQFLTMCDKLDLSYKRAYPAADWLNPKTVNLCLKTPEAIYDYQAFKNLIKKRIKKSSNITINLKRCITDIQFDNEGAKILTIHNGKRKIKQKFDYVINATYIHYNDFCDWLKFPKRPLEFRLKEVVVIGLDKKPQCAVTIMDGPFATIVPTAEKGVYTFGDVPLSIHESYTSGENLSLIEKRVKKLKSRWPQMQLRCKKWIPIIKNARYLDSMFVILPVEPSAKMTDARPTDITSHGFGCWSVFSGKIITCVSAAKKILKEVQNLSR